MTAASTSKDNIRMMTISLFNIRVEDAADLHILVCLFGRRLFLVRLVDLKRLQINEFSEEVDHSELLNDAIQYLLGFVRAGAELTKDNIKDTVFGNIFRYYLQHPEPPPYLAQQQGP